MKRKLFSLILAISLVLPGAAFQTASAGEMTINAEESESFMVDVESSDTVAGLKQKISDANGIDVDVQHIVFGGREYDGDLTLGECGIYGEEVLLVTSEFDIETKNCYAYKSDPTALSGTVGTVKGVPGTLVYLKNDQPPKGSYFTGEYIVNGTPCESGVFSMPNSNVTAEAVFGDKETYTVDLDNGDTSVEPEVMDILDGFGLVIEDGSARALDLDKDGNPDAEILKNSRTGEIFVSRMTTKSDLGEIYTYDVPDPQQRIGMVEFKVGRTLKYQEIGFGVCTDDTPILSKVYGDEPFSADAKTRSGSAKITYVSDVPGVLSVDENGVITILGSGTGSVTAMAAATNDYAFAKASLTVTVSKKKLDFEWGGSEFTYDGTEHCPTGSVKGLANGDVCTVTVSGGATDAGSYYASASIEGDEDFGKKYIYPDNLQKRFTIAKSDGNKVELSVPDRSYGTDPSDESLKPSVSDSIGTKSFVVEYKPADADDSLYSESVPTEVGDYTCRATAPETDNYLSAFTQTDFSIVSSEASFIGPKTVTGLVYSGRELELIRPGKSEDAVFTYSIDGDNWSSEIPAADDSGKYTVRYRVYRDSKDKEPFFSGTVSAEIKKAKNGLRLTERKASLYSHTDEVTVDVNDYVVSKSAQGKLSFKCEEGGISDPDFAGTGVFTVAPRFEGSFTITVSAAGTDNYEGAGQKITFTFVYIGSTIAVNVENSTITPVSIKNDDFAVDVLEPSVLNTGDYSAVRVVVSPLRDKNGKNIDNRLFSKNDIPKLDDGVVNEIKNAFGSAEYGILGITGVNVEIFADKNSGESEKIASADSVVAINMKASWDGRRDNVNILASPFAVLRASGENGAQALRKLGSVPEVPEDGTYYIDSENDEIIVFGSDFSDLFILWKAEEVVPEELPAKPEIDLTYDTQSDTDDSDDTDPGEDGKPTDSDDKTDPGEDGKPTDSDDKTDPGEGGKPTDSDDTDPGEDGKPTDSDDKTDPGEDGKPTDSDKKTDSEDGGKTSDSDDKTDTDESGKTTDSDEKTDSDSDGKSSDNTDSDKTSDTDTSSDKEADDPVIVKSIGIIGDANEDGMVDSADALLILRVSLDLETIPEERIKLADIDGDGKITSSDALEVQRYSVGMEANKRIGKNIKIR